MTLTRGRTAHGGIFCPQITQVTRIFFGGEGDGLTDGLLWIEIFRRSGLGGGSMHYWLQ
jgi:hypothetical protein